MTNTVRLMLAVSAVLLARSAYADLIMSLNDTGTGGVDVIIVDNAPAGSPTALGASTHADADATPGQIGVPVGLMAGSFLVDPATSAFNIGGGAENATVDLLLFVESTAAGTLEAMVTATDLTMDNDPDEIIADIGGFSLPDVGPAAITFTAAVDPGNGQFSFPVGSTVGPASLGGGAFSTTLTTAAVIPNPFSLSERITITADQPGQFIGFDASNQANPVPEPASLLLWTVASGVGLCVARRRCARRKGVAGHQPPVAT